MRVAQNQQICFITPSNSFFEVDPTQFRVGDIVEAQITVASVPIRNNKFKMISQLRCLALLDGTFTDVSIPYPNHIMPR